MADQYMFVASGDACSICSAMDGQVSDEPMELPHDNCMCQVVPVTGGDCPTYSVGPITGTGQSGTPHSFKVNAEISVTCCDGSEIGESADVDTGGNDSFEAMDEAMESAAKELMSQCPPGGPDAGSAPGVA